MNPKHLDARWRNAVAKFTKLQQLMSDGHVLRTSAGRCINKIEIGDRIIELVVEGHRDAYTWKDSRCDRMNLTIPIFNAQLRRWHYYPALAVRSAFTVSELMK